MGKIGTLYIVATPIGNLDDFSPRGVETLRVVDIVAAEDTRHSRRLLEHYAIATAMISLHEHNEEQRISEVLRRLEQGQSVALISDAGTPLISDPGYKLVREAHKNGIKVAPIPGPCALIAALSAAGLPSDRFVFEGFLSAKSGHRKQQLEALKNESRTVIFYEAPHRIMSLVDDMTAIFGADRYIVLARELTKTFETIHGDTLKNLKTWLENDANQQKGEFVVLVQGAEINENKIEHIESQRVLDVLLAELPASQAVALAAKITGEKKNQLYKQALKK